MVRATKLTCRRLTWSATALLALLTYVRTLAADEGAVDLEVPVLVLEQEPAGEVELEETDLSQMVISSAKHIETVQENASIVTVVTHDEIVDHGYLALSDLLDTIPGFEGHRPSFSLATTEAFARGNPRTVLFLWNGVSINSPQNNRRALGPYLPLDAIDRVEVVSGPGGVLWGADAFLGIVSITTLGSVSNDPVNQAKVALGTGSRSHGEYRASATVAERWLDGRLGLRATVGMVTSQGPQLDPGYDVIIGPPTAPDSDGTFTVRPGSGALRNRADLWVPLSLGLDVGDFHLDVLYPLVARQFNEVNDRGLRTDQYVSPSGDVIVGESSRRAENVTLASVSYTKDVARRSRVTGRAYFSGFEDIWNRQIEVPPGLLGDQLIIGEDRYMGMNSYLHDGAYRYGLGADLSHDGTRSRLVLGAELYVEGIHEIWGNLSGGLVSGSDFLRYRAGRRLVTASFVEDEWRLTPRLVVKAGVRGQYAPRSYVPLALGSLAVRAEVAKGIDLKMNVAQGFRPPAFEETQGNDDPFSDPYPHRQSNQALKPERSLSAETELSGLVTYPAGPLRRLAARAGYQYTRLDDLIVIGPTGIPENSNRRVIHSAEMRADLRFRGGHRLVAGYTYLIGEDLGTGPMRNIPQHRFNVACDLGLASHLRGFVGLTASGGVEDLNRRASLVSGLSSIASPAEVTVDRLPAAATVDLGLRAPSLMNEHLEVALDVTNLFDQVQPVADPNFDSREAIFSIPSLGRSVMASLSWRM